MVVDTSAMAFEYMLNSGALQKSSLTLCAPAASSPRMLRSLSLLQLSPTTCCTSVAQRSPSAEQMCGRTVLHACAHMPCGAAMAAAVASAAAAHAGSAQTRSGWQWSSGGGWQQSASAVDDNDDDEECVNHTTGGPAGKEAATTPLPLAGATAAAVLLPASVGRSSQAGRTAHAPARAQLLSSRMHNIT